MHEIKLKVFKTVRNLVLGVTRPIESSQMDMIGIIGTNFRYTFDQTDRKQLETQTFKSHKPEIV